MSLSNGPKHGYAIMQDVEGGTGRPMGAGTLYAALARLEEQGLIEPLPPVDRRRPYRLRCYPARWRARYGDEFEVLLEERPLKSGSAARPD